MRRRTLAPPQPAVREHRRAHLNPKSGWFRRIERATSLYLSQHVWPRVPGSALPYGEILRRHLTVAEAEIPILDLARTLDGLTVLLVSDVHAGPFLSRRALADAFARLATLSADIVVHGGDIATSNVDEALVHREAIAGLKGRLGTFAVYGNHDHYTGDLEGVGRLFASCGVRVLHNDAAAVSDGDGAGLALAGIDDWNIGRADLAAAIAKAAEVAPGRPIILISHNPDASLQAAAKGVALTLAGHTHGGQVRIPGRPVLVRMSRYFLDEGRFEHDGMQIVVSRGLGVSGIPLRIACAPEAVLVTLRRSG
jgi:predicted MPP superfamily phosphohydrolase